MDLTNLKKPFLLNDLEWRIQSAGYKRDGKEIWARVLCYITARAIQDRLDEVCGMGNWWNEFRVGPGGGVLCGISILTENGCVTKWNGAENTDIESVKGGLSDAEKRAGVEWGIGRYLYNLTADFADIANNGICQGNFQSDSGKVYFRWNPPVNKLPEWALTEDEKNFKKSGKNMLTLLL